MASFSRVTLVGNLVRDPELRYIPSGTPICTFSMAINRKYKQGDEWKESTSFIDIETWGRQAETAGEYLKKGRMVLVDGRLEQDRWEAQDGTKRSKLKVVANQIVFLSSGRDQESSSASPSDAAAQKPLDDDIPF